MQREDNPTATEPTQTAQGARTEEEQGQLDAQLLHVQKMESLGMLAGGVAHDFNNLLMVVSGNVELALMELPEDSPAKHCLDQICTVSKKAGGLCRELLAFAGKTRLADIPLNVSELASKTAQSFETPTSPKVRISYELPQGLPLIKGDPSLLSQVLLNLLTNASEAIDGTTGDIALRTSTKECSETFLSRNLSGHTPPEGTYVCIRISDTGSGMDEVTLSRIFDPFFTTKTKGRGLGLSTTVGIVRSHGGALLVDSTPGTGTVFQVLLPVACNTASETGETKEGLPGWRGSGTLLLVDDEESVLDMTGRMLTRMGFDVVTAANGREAMELFRTRPHEFRGLVCDMVMPEMNGEETFWTARGLRPDVPVLVCSGYTEGGTPSFCQKEEHVLFIEKPFAAVTLNSALHSLLGG